MKPRDDSFKEMLTRLGVVLLSLAAAFVVLKLNSYDFSVPSHYSEDSLVKSMLIKSVIDNGWYLYNPLVGAPAGLNMHDYPMTSNLDLFLIKCFTLFFPDHAVVINLYFLFTFPLICLSSFWVMRQLGISRPVSLTASVLFTCLPYHFMRGQNHLFLANYFTVPLLVWLTANIYKREPLFFRSSGPEGKLSLKLGGFKPLGAVFICILMASSAVYYAFFSCFFILAGTFVSFLKWKNSRHLVSGMIVLFITMAVFMVNLSPYIYHSLTLKQRNTSFFRNPIESEIFGLKINQLLSPVDGHRIEFVSELKSKYNAYSPLVNENRTATLGAIGSFGFLFLLFWLIYRACNGGWTFFDDRRDRLLTLISTLNISAVLLGTIGGFGSIFAYVISSNIRCYNRISIYIAFFSLLGISVLADRVFFQKTSGPIRYGLTLSLIALLLLFGLWDQTSPHFALRQPAAEKYKSDARFIYRIENILPENAMIFQLPYSFFPEPRIRHGMKNYDHFKAYLHSRKRLRWSYGAIRGRKGDEWQEKVSQMPPEKFLTALSFSGFSGIYVNLHGYEDRGESLLKIFTALLERPPIMDERQVYAFFDLTPFNKRFRRQFTEAQWKVMRKQALFPLEP